MLNKKEPAILFIDDEKDTSCSHIIEYIELNTRDVIIEAVNNFFDADQILEKKNYDIKLIILDIIMAPGDYNFAEKGHELESSEFYSGGKAYLSVLNKHYPDINLIILSVLEKKYLENELHKFKLKSDIIYNKFETDPSVLLDVIKSYI